MLVVWLSLDFRCTIHVGMQEWLLRRFNGTCHTHEKKIKHIGFSVFDSLSIHISVSKILLQLGIVIVTLI